MSDIKKIGIDVDGVLRDFSGDLYEVIKRERPQWLKPGVDAVLTMTPSNRSPWFNMVCSGDDGFLRLVNCEGGHQVIRRQDAPQCFDLTTVAYAIRPDFILSSNSFWDGSVLGVEIPPERAIDIDTPLDFAIARFIYVFSSFGFNDVGGRLNLFLRLPFSPA